MEEGPDLSASTSPSVGLKGVSMVYATSQGTKLEAVREVSLEVRSGETVSIVGRSGCGKTTLLKVVAGLLRPTAGSVAVGGAEVTSPLRNIGFVFQIPLLVPWRRVIDNVLLPIELLGRDKSRYEDKAKELLRICGLAGFEGLYQRELSGGMQQRVALARALIHDPGILLLDEPFGSLDELSREEMVSELLKITESLNKTVLFVTHSIPEAVMVGDRVVLLSSRPSTVTKDIRIDLPRPRDSGTRTDQRFAAYCEEIRAALGLGGQGHGGRDGLSTPREYLSS